SARVARVASRGRHSAMGWFSLGGNLGFAAAPVLVTAVVAAGGLALTPLLVVPALAGSVLCLPVLRALDRRGPSTSGPKPGSDDVAAFLRLSAAVVFRSVVFAGLSTFIALYARQRTGGGVAAGSLALLLLYLGGAVGTVLGSRLADRWDRVTVLRWSYLATVVAVAGVVFVPGPAVYVFVALTSACLYVPFSLQVTLAQDYLPTRVGTAGGVTLGLTVSIGGLASPLIGTIADHTTLRTALAPLVVVPALAWLAVRRLREPALPTFDEPVQHAA
ncbi:MAG: MFS transporter, partial [Saccharothrix sp.]|nr:MFS transporter [Saccharothrix sp.]